MGFGGLDTKYGLSIHILNSILVIYQFLIGKSYKKVFDFWENYFKIKIWFWGIPSCRPFPWVCPKGLEWGFGGVWVRLFGFVRCFFGLCPCLTFFFGVLSLFLRFFFFALPILGDIQVNSLRFVMGIVSTIFMYDFGGIFWYYMGISNWKYDFGKIRADYSFGYARRALGWSFWGILGQVIQKINMNFGKYFHAPSRQYCMKLATHWINVELDD